MPQLHKHFNVRRNTNKFVHMKKSWTLPFFFFLCLASSFGQNNNNVSRISLRATTSVSGGEYFIDILGKGDSFKIIYKFKDSLSRKLEKDTAFIQARNLLLTFKNPKPSNDTVVSLLLKLDSLNQAYTSYSIDSIKLSYDEAPSYVALIKSVLASSAEALENHNRKRVFVDGTEMKFTLTNNAATKVVYVHSPSNESNPLLYSLISETLDVYRKRKGDNFMTKQRTSGY
jgi:hypothetical protein